MRILILLALLIGSPLLRAENTDEKARELDKLLSHLGYDESLPRMLGNLLRTMQKTYAPMNLPQKAWDEVAKELTYAEIRTISARLYSAKLTLEEIKAANAFYESDIGRSYAKKIAEVGEQEYYAAREWAGVKIDAILKKYSKGK